MARGAELSGPPDFWCKKKIDLKKKNPSRYAQICTICILFLNISGSPVSQALCAVNYNLVRTTMATPKFARYSQSCTICIPFFFYFWGRTPAPFFPGRLAPSITPHYARLCYVKIGQICLDFYHLHTISFFNLPGEEPWTPFFPGRFAPSIMPRCILLWLCQNFSDMPGFAPFNVKIRFFLDKKI